VGHVQLGLHPTPPSQASPVSRRLFPQVAETGAEGAFAGATVGELPVVAEGAFAGELPVVTGATAGGLPVVAGTTAGGLPVVAGTTAGGLPVVAGATAGVKAVIQPLLPSAII
jgi:hypothetical protein